MRLPFALWSGAALLAVPLPAFAQAVVQPLPSPNNPADRLAAQMRLLAANPKDIEALVTAGELANQLDDSAAAAAFFTRAEKINPRNARLEAGEGTLLLGSERPGEALRRFAEAEALGLPATRFVRDRGLAYDLIGEQERAQRDYRAALRNDPTDDEVTRRYALSLGISGKREAALAALDPLIRRGDRPAWRARAFVLAMDNDLAGARSIAATMLPAGMAQGLQPYFERLPTLGSADRAFAVHFGETRPSASRMADARLVPVLPALGPDPYAPVAVAAQTAPVPVVEDRRSRRKRGRRGGIAVAAVPPATPLAAALPQPPTYQSYTAASPTSAPFDRVASVIPSGPRAARSPTAQPPVRVANTSSDVRRAAPPAFTAQVPSLTSGAAASSYPAGSAAAMQPPVRVAMASTVRPPIVFAPGALTPLPVPVLTSSAPAASLAAGGAAPTAAPAAIPVGGASSLATRRLPAATASSAGSLPAPGFSAAVSGAAPATTPVTVSRSEDAILAGLAAGRASPIVATAPPPPAAPPPRAAPLVADKPAAAVAVTTPTARTPAKPAVAARTERPAKPAATASSTRSAVKSTSRKSTTDAEPLADVETKPADRGKTKSATQRKTDAKVAEAKRPKTDAETDEPKTAAKRTGKVGAPAKTTGTDGKAADGKFWVQVAGGAEEGDLQKAWKAVQAKSAALKGRQGYTTPLRATNRVLTGPFKSEEEAQGFVNTLARQGVSGFTFEKTAGQKVARLSSMADKDRDKTGTADAVAKDKTAKTKSGGPAKAASTDRKRGTAKPAEAKSSDRGKRPSDKKKK